jgi:hypothetical protein
LSSTRCRRVALDVRLSRYSLTPAYNELHQSLSDSEDNKMLRRSLRLHYVLGHLGLEWVNYALSLCSACSHKSVSYSHFSSGIALRFEPPLTAWPATGIHHTVLLPITFSPLPSSSRILHMRLLSLNGSLDCNAFSISKVCWII